MNTNALRAVRPPVISNRDAAEIRALMDSASLRDRAAAAVPSAARVSVLAPIGSALIGLRIGDLLEWALPSGRVRRYLVVLVEPPSPGGA